MNTRLVTTRMAIERRDRVNFMYDSVPRTEPYEMAEFKAWCYAILAIVVFFVWIRW